jgi:hypothetical protein
VVLVWTLPSHLLRRVPAIRAVHNHVLRKKFSRRVRRIADEHRAGGASAADTGAAISHTLRSFLHQSTGTAAQYMHVDAIIASDLAAAGPLFAALNDAQFNGESSANVHELSDAAEELIRTWS